jgi:uncharacterized lipoprotein
MSFPRFVIVSAAATLLSGCYQHIINRLNPDCHVKQEYQQATQVAALKVPEGLDAPNTQGALVIPSVELAPPPPGPKDACLDLPPKYVPAPQNKAASG